MPKAERTEIAVTENFVISETGTVKGRRRSFSIKPKNNEWIEIEVPVGYEVVETGCMVGLYPSEDLNAYKPPKKKHQGRDAQR